MIKPHGSEKLNPLYVMDDAKRAALVKEAEGLPSILGSSAAAANAVISRNGSRRDKRLWTDTGSGPPIVGYVADDEHDDDPLCGAHAVRRSVVVGGRLLAAEVVDLVLQQRLEPAVVARGRRRLLRGGDLATLLVDADDPVAVGGVLVGDPWHDRLGVAHEAEDQQPDAEHEQYRHDDDDPERHVCLPVAPCRR